MFGVDTDGTGFTNLYTFTIRMTTSGFFANSDGAAPLASLLLTGNTLYGTASAGGRWGNGAIFMFNTDGTGFTNLHNFTPCSVTPADAFVNWDGMSPKSRLILSSGALYGTAIYGGTWGNGTVFKVNTDGSGFNTLHSFTTISGYPSYANYDGANPPVGLVLSSNTLYGVTANGGSSGLGTLFAINIDGSGFRTLHNFSGANSDGGYPYGELVSSGNILYGTTTFGGSFSGGTVFMVKTDGTDFDTLHSFTASSGWVYTNSDGDVPYGGLTLSANTLYGTTSADGRSGQGTVFKVNTDGSGFGTLYSFTGRGDGGQPDGTLILSGNTLYGTASAGGIGGSGTVFSLVIPPQLAIIAAGNTVFLAWPTNFNGYTLQSTTNLASPMWTTNLPAPVVVNGLNTVTNPISGTQQFFRLSQ